MAFNYQGVDLPFDQFTHEGNAAQQVITAFRDLVKRDPTQAEIAQYSPVVLAGDPNIGNVPGLRAEVAKLASQQTQAIDQNGKEAQTVNGIYQQKLGRGASQDELDHFGTLLKSGQMDAFSLGSFIDQLPEVVKKQDAEFRQGLSSDLQKGDAQYYNEQILPGIQSTYAKQGRSFDSSSYAQALAQAAQGQNRQREAYLSNLTAQQYGGSQAGAREDYLNNISRRYQMNDQSWQTSQDYNNFNLQKQAYDDYLKRYGKRGGGASGVIAGGMSGAMTGGMVGGPWGALAGGVAGAGLGYFG